jgi:glycine oxidase
MTNQVTIIGCGVVGAVLAYELSKVSSLQITVLEAASQPAQSATGAALGVLMAACSNTLRGDLVNLRLASLRLYDQLISELAIATKIAPKNDSEPNLKPETPYHQAGILCLYGSPEAEVRSQTLIAYRQKQGFPLQWLSQPELSSQYPQFQALGGLYSPLDLAIHPTKFVQSLVSAAAQNGVEFRWNCPIAALQDLPQDRSNSDWIVVTAGMGANQLLSPLLAADIPDPELLQPIGGQAIAVHIPNLNLQQVVHMQPIDGPYVNIVPMGGDRYWIGATVEFEATKSSQQLPIAANIPLLLESAIGFCPEFTKAEVLETWAGDRPRPKANKAPILGFLPNHPHVLLAIGHYRNGILMAPVTAQITRDLILHGNSDFPWRKFSLQ